MADFTSSGWSIFITVVTLVSIAACFVLALSLASKKAPAAADGSVDTTGDWDYRLAGGDGFRGGCLDFGSIRDAGPAEFHDD